MHVDVDLSEFLEMAKVAESQLSQRALRAIYHHCRNEDVEVFYHFLNEWDMYDCSLLPIAIGRLRTVRSFAW